MPKFKLHAAERITQEDGRLASTWKPGSDKALFLHGEGDSVPRFLAARGEHWAQKTQHNTTQHTHTHTHGEETKGKETLIRYYASSASWTAATTRVRQASGVDTVFTEEASGFSTRSYGLKLHFRFSSPSIFSVIWVQPYIILHYITRAVTIAAIVWSTLYRRTYEFTACLSYSYMAAA